MFDCILVSILIYSIQECFVHALFSFTSLQEEDQVSVLNSVTLNLFVSSFDQVSQSFLCLFHAEENMRLKEKAEIILRVIDKLKSFGILLLFDKEVGTDTLKSFVLIVSLKHCLVCLLSLIKLVRSNQSYNRIDLE